MLGENHSLLNEFPQFEDTINALLKSDKVFFDKTQRYNVLDNEIRELELANSPIDDVGMHEKKKHRSALKDDLYKVITKQR